MNIFAPFNSDGYKLGHAAMYADGTTKVYSNLTPRSDRIYRERATRYYDGHLHLVGLQGAMHELVESWDQSFFSKPKAAVVARFKKLCDNYLGPDVVSTEGIEKLHDLGYLPLEIKTLDEGTKVPMGIPVLTITNTVDHAYWLVNFLETTISDLTWKTSTNATIAGEYKAMLKDFAIQTGSPLEGLLFQAHDFSARGMSGPEDAARSGIGHLAHFLGSDTLGAVIYAQDYYGAGDFVAASVPATEHAVATSNILLLEEEGDELMDHGFMNRIDAERAFLIDLITRKFPKGIVSYVADSFDFWGVLTEVLPAVKDVIMARETNGITPGKLVIRPDSGDPVKIVCGMKPVADENGKAIDFESEEAAYDFFDSWGGIYHKFKYADCIKIDGVFYDFSASDDGCGIDTDIVYPYHVVDGAVGTLWKTFGGTKTSEGYKLLDEHIGLIYGDSITPQRCLAILEGLKARGFASTNVVFGVGSYTYQCNTRDSFGFAVKATYTEVGDRKVSIFKAPKTDSKKNSARGLLFVNRNGADKLVLHDDVTKEGENLGTNLLKTRFKDGKWSNQVTLDEIRQRLA